MFTSLGQVLNQSAVTVDIALHSKLMGSVSVITEQQHVTALTDSGFAQCSRCREVCFRDSSHEQVQEGKLHGGGCEVRVSSFQLGW